MNAAVFPRLAEHRAQRTHDAAAAYLRLVQQVADGEDIMPEDAAAILDAADKEDAELHADVDRILHRRQAAETLGRLKDAEAELPRIAQQKEALRAKLEAANGVRFFFATPHHSWERGTCENTRLDPSVRPQGH